MLELSPKSTLFVDELWSRFAELMISLCGSTPTGTSPSLYEQPEHRTDTCLAVPSQEHEFNSVQL